MRPLILARGTPIAVALLLAACSGSGTPSATTAAASASPSAAGEAPSVSFSWPDGDQPVVTRELTGIDESFINPGAVLEHENRLHMFANVFTAWPGRVSIPHLVSDDGVNWSVDPAEPVLTSDDIPLTSNGADVSTGFVTDDGTWVLIFETVTTTEPWVLGQATAPDPAGPWTIDPQPILELGPAGSWDAAGHSWPSVVRTDAGYLMFFTGLDERGANGAGSIGLATSSDGKSWVKRDEPVMTAQADWEDGSLDRPRVVSAGQGLLMVYAGRDLTKRGVARSTDGQAWQRDGDGPAITQDDFPADGRCWDAALINRNGALTYYLEIGSASAGRGTQVYRAVAELPPG
ncbi:MAG TPA: hypothetical protein VF013_08345 [Candidatus Limnocylindria bacterium]